MPELYETYRPRTWDEFIGQPKAIAMVRRLLARPGFDGGALLINGPTGTGKTSLAWIIARVLACDFHIQEIDGDQCSVDVVRDIGREMYLTTLDGGYRVYIVNEIHNCTPRAVQAWLTTLERRPPRVLFLFTTTSDSDSLFGEYCGPFGSRCKIVNFTNQGLAKAFAARLVEIADREGLNGRNGDTLKAALRIVQQAHNNMRTAIQAVDFGEMLD